MKVKVRPKKKLCTLLDCPKGLFFYPNGKKLLLCFKTEYGTTQGGVEAYIVSSGERLSCGGLTMTAKGCESINVFPCKVIGKKVH